LLSHAEALFGVFGRVFLDWVAGTGGRTSPTSSRGEIGEDRETTTSHFEAHAGLALALIAVHFELAFASGLLTVLKVDG
jgi:hypothetical protein